MSCAIEVRKFGKLGFSKLDHHERANPKRNCGDVCVKNIIKFARKFGVEHFGLMYQCVSRDLMGEKDNRYHKKHKDRTFSKFAVHVVIINNKTNQVIDLANGKTEMIDLDRYVNDFFCLSQSKKEELGIPDRVCSVKLVGQNLDHILNDIDADIDDDVIELHLKMAQHIDKTWEKFGKEIQLKKKK